MTKKTKTPYITILFITAMILLAGFHIQAISLGKNQLESRMVSLSEASKVASHFLQTKGKQDNYTIEDIEILYDFTHDLHIGYLIHLSPKGYIVIGPDTSIHPVIAYSFTSSAPMDPEDNPFYRLLATDITNQLSNFNMVSSDLQETMINKWEYYESTEWMTDESDDFQQWPPEESTSTEGWIETTWSQYGPYNAFCPIDPTNDDARSIAGCPAIAMGQILNYHRTINNVQFNDQDDYYHDYSSSFWIDNDHTLYDFPSFPELNGYLTTVEDHYENNLDLTDDDLASICFACGVAAEQVYSFTGSGTFGVDQAFDAYQRFSCDTATLYYKPDNSVLDLIIDNIKQALPVHFAVVTPQWNAGHNLIIDGYNTDGYFHLNFGWSGQYDGWYFIPDNLPYQLTVIEGVIVDILKKSTNEDLNVEGSLVWQNRTRNETVQGSFTIENIGEQNSLLDWEVISVPEWGNWTITPSEGHSLRPIDGKVTIQVTCILPNEYRKDYSDSITIMNTNNPSDRGYVPITVNLPKEKHDMSWLWDVLTYYFPMLQDLFDLFN